MSIEWGQYRPREEIEENKPACGRPWLSPRGLLSYYIIAVIIWLIAVITLSHVRTYLLTPREVNQILPHLVLTTKPPS